MVTNLPGDPTAEPNTWKADEFDPWAAAVRDATPVQITTTKGDLIVATSGSAVDRLAAGTNGHVLKANSATTTGLEWAAESGGSTYTGDTYEVWVDDYGAVGDGTTDDSTAFDDAFDAVIAAITTRPDTVTRPTVKLRLGAKSYKIVSGNTLIKLSAVSGVANGLVIQGMGRSATQVIFAPAASAYLCNNQDDWGYLTFADIEFYANTSNANFLRSQRTGTTGNAVHNYIFERCRWTGAWGTIFDISGDENNSEWTFYKADWFLTSVTRILDSGSDSNDAAVNFAFWDCQAYIGAGIGFEWTKGGNITVVGGSWIGEANVDIFRLIGTGHGNGVTNFVRLGGRYELRANTVRSIYCEWDYGNVTSIGVDEGAMIPFVAAYSSATFLAYASGGGVNLRYAGCTIHGRHEFIYEHSVSPVQASYENCNFYSETNPEDAFTYTAHAVNGGSIANAPVIHLRQCKGTGNRIVSADLNWYRAARAETSRRLWFLRAYDSLNPSNGFEEIVLPKNVMIVGAGMVVRGSIGTVGGVLQIRTTEGTPTVLVTKTGVNAAFTTINEMNATPPAGSTTLPFRCDSDAKRTIRLVADANVNATRSDGDFWIETVG